MYKAKVILQKSFIMYVYNVMQINFAGENEVKFHLTARNPFYINSSSLALAAGLSASMESNVNELHAK